MYVCMYVCMYVYTRIIILHTHSCALYTHPVICARARRPESVPTPAEKPKEEDPWPKESDQEESPMTTWEINYIKYHKFTSTRGSLVTHTPRGAGAVVFFSPARDVPPGSAGRCGATGGAGGGGPREWLHVTWQGPILMRGDLIFPIWRFP